MSDIEGKAARGREGNQPRFRAKGFGENPAMMVFAFKDITGWTKGSEHINRLELFFKDRDHLIEKWETLKPDGTKVHLYLSSSRCVRPLPRGFTGHVARPARSIRIRTSQEKRAGS